jgi:hypothetical protein
MNAPIILFAYDRLAHTRQTVEALLRNIGVRNHDLFIYSDAPRTLSSESAVSAVRDYLKTIAGFRSITIRYRKHNYGLAKSIIDGVTEVLMFHEQVIVMEDDLITSPYFLNYMNDGLKYYANNDEVISIHGYVYPIKQNLKEPFFLRGADCWGWATWRRGWALFNSDGQALLDGLTNRNLTNEFDFNGSFPFTEMLKSQVKGDNDSWAIRWYASAFLADKLTLYPNRSLVHNIGNDKSGTHSDNTAQYNSNLSESPIILNAKKIEDSKLGRIAFENFFRQKNHRMYLNTIIQFFRNYLRKFEV